MLVSTSTVETRSCHIPSTVPLSYAQTHVLSIGIIKTSDFCSKSNIDAASLKASRLCAMVFRLFSTRNKALICKLFTTYIRPLLEYASIAWNPQESEPSCQLESMQQCFTKRLFGRHASS